MHTFIVSHMPTALWIGCEFIVKNIQLTLLDILGVEILTLDILRSDILTLDILGIIPMLEQICLQSLSSYHSSGHTKHCFLLFIAIDTRNSIHSI